jgi:polyphenol oxidase
LSIPAPELSARLAWRHSGEIVWLEAPLGDARAAFTTRAGGVSAGPYSSLNLGILTDDDPAHVSANRRVLAGALGRDARGVVMGFQVHGAEVQLHESAPMDGAYSTPGAPLAPSDVQVAAHGALTPLVLVADCFPLALAAPGAVAMAHCGWKGVVAGVVERAVESLREAGGVEPSHVHAALGPGIGPCCYEVGADVRSAFTAKGDQTAILDRDRLDLAQAIETDLERCGVRADRLAKAGLCTACHPELFYSHRRDGGVTGRQAGLAWLDV